MSLSHHGDGEAIIQSHEMLAFWHNCTALRFQITSIFRSRHNALFSLVLWTLCPRAKAAVQIPNPSGGSANKKTVLSFYLVGNHRDNTNEPPKSGGAYRPGTDFWPTKRNCLLHWIKLCRMTGQQFAVSKFIIVSSMFKLFYFAQGRKIYETGFRENQFSYYILNSKCGLDNGARFFVIGTLSNTGKSGVQY